MVDTIKLKLYSLSEFKEKGVIKMVIVRFNDSINVVGQIKTEVEELFCFFTLNNNLV